jgi:hypothetical protein
MRLIGLNYIFLFFVLGFEVSHSQLEEAAIQSGVLEWTDDYLEQEFREICQELLPNPEQVSPEDCVTADISLKERYVTQQSMRVSDSET